MRAAGDITVTFRFNNGPEYGMIAPCENETLRKDVPNEENVVLDEMCEGRDKRDPPGVSEGRDKRDPPGAGYARGERDSPGAGRRVRRDDGVRPAAAERVVRERVPAQHQRGV